MDTNSKGTNSEHTQYRVLPYIHLVIPTLIPTPRQIPYPKYTYQFSSFLACGFHLRFIS